MNRNGAKAFDQHRWEVPSRAAQRVRVQFNRKERDMRLNSARVEQALNQFDAEVIPESHPAMPQLKGLYGDHTFFLSANGLNIVEPIGPSDAGVQEGNVVNLADWADSKATSFGRPGGKAASRRLRGAEVEAGRSASIGSSSNSVGGISGFSLPSAPEERGGDETHMVT